MHLEFWSDPMIATKAQLTIRKIQEDALERLEIYPNTIDMG